jgi:hypothetical protein
MHIIANLIQNSPMQQLSYRNIPNNYGQQLFLYLYLFLYQTIQIDDVTKNCEEKIPHFLARVAILFYCNMVLHILLYENIYAVCSNPNETM